MSRRDYGRTVCVILAYINVACLIVYLVWLAPARNVQLQQQKAAVEAVVQRAAALSFAEAVPRTDHSSGYDADRSAALVSYLEQHGVRPEWLCEKPEDGSNKIAARRNNCTEALWWLDHVQEQRAAVIPFGASVWQERFCPPRYSPHTVPSRQSCRRRAKKDHEGTSAVQLVVPPGSLPGFTMNGTVPIPFRFRDTVPSSPPERKGGQNSRQRSTASTQQRKYTKRDFVRILTAIHRMVETPQYHREVASAKMQRAFTLAVKSMRDSHIVGRDVLVVGSLREPYVEIVLLAVGGAARVFSIDYHPFISPDHRIVSLSVERFWSCREDKEAPCVVQQRNATIPLHIPNHFDVIIAYHTVQHEGLGRFGDSVNSAGDLLLMSELHCLLAPHSRAVLMLAVPLGNDCVVFNQHRVYGRRRLPLLLLGFDVVTVHGFDVQNTVSESGGAAVAQKSLLSLGESWAVDNRCLGDLQRAPILVLTVSAASLSSLCEGTCRAVEGSNALVCETFLVRSWHRVPGLLGPYPPFIADV